MCMVKNIFVTHSVRNCLTWSICIVFVNGVVNSDDHVTRTIIINNRNKLICPCQTVVRQIERECTYII